MYKIPESILWRLTLYPIFPKGKDKKTFEKERLLSAKIYICSQKLFICCFHYEQETSIFKNGFTITHSHIFTLFNAEKYLIMEEINNYHSN